MSVSRAYNGVAALVAFGIPLLARWTSPKVGARRSVWCAARSGCFPSSSFKEPRLLLGSMVGVGIAWASILSMPYAILTGSLPPSKLGYYMGVFNFFIVIPQIVAAALLGFIVGRFFDGQRHLRPADRRRLVRCSPRRSPCGSRTGTTWRSPHGTPSVPSSA